jgi:hypothetical protein
MPKPARPTGKAKPPLDFTGVWKLDEAASQNVSRQMEGALLSVKQNGNRIWIEPSAEDRSKILAEQIVVDGRLYEKAVGKQKATLQAQWGTDHETLWLQVVGGGDENPNSTLQRSVWRLRDFGNTWTRQTWTINGDQTKVSFYVFRKRAAALAPSPTPAPDSRRRTPKP